MTDTPNAATTCSSCGAPTGDRGLHGALCFILSSFHEEHTREGNQNDLNCHEWAERIEKMLWAGDLIPRPAGVPEDPADQSIRRMREVFHLRWGRYPIDDDEEDERRLAAIRRWELDCGPLPGESVRAERERITPQQRVNRLSARRQDRLTRDLFRLRHGRECDWTDPQDQRLMARVERWVIEEGALFPSETPEAVRESVVRDFERGVPDLPELPL